MAQVAEPWSMPSVTPSRLTRLARRLAERRHYRRRRDWLWSLYNRLLGKSPLLWLPFRRGIRAVYLSDVPGAVYSRLGTTDWVVIDEVFVRREYDFVLASDLGPVKQIVDLGANIGLSIRLWQTYFPAARVIAVEPDRGNLEICRRNVDAGPAPERVILVSACAAGTPRDVDLDRTRGEYAISMRDPQPGASSDRSGVVKALTVPQILDQCDAGPVIDLLKCDIEGAEREVFADCREWIGRIRHMVVELHAPYRRSDFLADLARGQGRFDVIRCHYKGDSTVLMLRNAAR